METTLAIYHVHTALLCTRAAAHAQGMPLRLTLQRGVLLLLRSGCLLGTSRLYILGAAGSTNPQHTHTPLRRQGKAYAARHVRKQSVPSQKTQHHAHFTLPLPGTPHKYTLHQRPSLSASKRLTVYVCTARWQLPHGLQQGLVSRQGARVQQLSAPCCGSTLHTCLRSCSLAALPSGTRGSHWQPSPLVVLPDTHGESLWLCGHTGVAKRHGCMPSCVCVGVTR